MTKKTKKKSLTKYVDENAEEIDKVIKDKVPNGGKIDREERRLWVLNDEALYLAAKAKGVDV